MLFWFMLLTDAQMDICEVLHMYLVYIMLLLLMLLLWLFGLFDDDGKMLQYVVYMYMPSKSVV